MNNNVSEESIKELRKLFNELFYADLKVYMASNLPEKEKVEAIEKRVNSIAASVGEINDSVNGIGESIQSISENTDILLKKHEELNRRIQNNGEILQQVLGVHGGVTLEKRFNDLANEMREVKRLGDDSNQKGRTIINYIMVMNGLILLILMLVYFKIG